MWDYFFSNTPKAILGKPAPGTSGVEWLVAECEHHCDTLDAVAPSYEFLKGQLA